LENFNFVVKCFKKKQRRAFQIIFSIRREDQNNPSNAELNSICHLLALLGAHHILQFGRVRVNVKLKIAKFLSTEYCCKNISNIIFLEKNKDMLHEGPNCLL